MNFKSLAKKQQRPIKFSFFENRDGIAHGVLIGIARARARPFFLEIRNRPKCKREGAWISFLLLLRCARLELVPPGWMGGSERRASFTQAASLN
jgi:hypothetical protein